MIIAYAANRLPGETPQQPPSSGRSRTPGNIRQVIDWLVDDSRFFVQTLRLIWVYCNEPIGKMDYTDDEFAEGYAAFSLYQKINQPSDQLAAMTGGKPASRR